MTLASALTGITPVMQLRPVFLSLGIMVMLLGLAMIPSALVDIARQRAEWPSFALSAFVTGFFGLCLYILARGGDMRTGTRETFLLVVVIWIVLPLFAAIPFLSSGMGFTDAMFESISGLTTTGATVLTGLDNLPPGLLLWRAILQWIGGIGIIVTAIAILPQLGVGGMQLFALESSDHSAKFLSRIRDIAIQMSLVYLILTVVCAILYVQTGMTPFNAIAHAMTTLSAGGYSTHDASLSQYNETATPWVAIVFMFVAGLPFVLLARALFRAEPKYLLSNSELRLFAGLIAVFTAILMAQHAVSGFARFDNSLQALRDTLFNVISVMTGTGYKNAPYDTWGDPALAAFLIIMFLGGCAGSAACGLKMLRLELSAKAVLAHAQKMTFQRRLAPVRFNGRTVSETDLQSVMVFVFLYLMTFVVSAVLLAVLGNDMLTSISGAATSVSNVGPGLGPVIGPDGTFQTLSTASKWVCAIAMLLGRLEFVPLFALLTRRFWWG
ncbi:MAG: TrkH family potassium uptake protein [Pseudomonadota bacterium]